MLLSEGDDLTIATSDLQSKGHSFLTSPKHSDFFPTNTTLQLLQLKEK